MKKHALSFLFLLLLKAAFSQTVYFFPGQGSDECIFEKIQLDSTYKKVYLSYPVPDRKDNMRSYALKIARDVDTTSPYIFIGVSLGGMLISELSDVYRPQKAIIISSAKCRSELPARYRFQKYVPLNLLVPAIHIKIGALVLQPLVEPDSRRNKQERHFFETMLRSKKARYLKRTVNMIINWEKEQAPGGIIHIHGTWDHTLPHRNIKADYLIENGSHMMTYTRGEEINGKIMELLRR
ncbi:MAG: alpha/beta hydrolase [Bacteroidota bacterium]